MTLRLLKIAERLKELGEVDFSPNLSEPSIVQVAKTYLEDKGFNGLLENLESYNPIPISLLRVVIGYIIDLPEWLQKYNYKLPFVISCSIVDKGTRIVFWDIVQPRLKYSL